MHMKSQKILILALFILLTTSCATGHKFRMIDPAPEKMYFEGFSLLTPDEKGWFYVKNERIERGILAHKYLDGFGDGFLQTMMAELDENYVLRTTILPFPNFEKNGEFLNFVKGKLVNNEYTDRHKKLERYQQPFKTGGKNCVLDHYLGKDLKAKKTSSNSDPMFLEVMHCICLHPNDNTALYFGYSYRYYSENKDLHLKDNALSILNNIEYSEIKEQTKNDFKSLAENELKDLIFYIKKGFFSI